MSQSFNDALSSRHLLRHPFYQAWMAGTLSQSMLQDYAKQYYHHVERFPRYISAIHSGCEDADARELLLQNLNEEEGTGFDSSHPELWLNFAKGMGAEEADVQSTAPRKAIRNVAQTFFRHARGSYAAGLGALYAYEAQVPEIAESKIKGLRENYAVNDPKTLEFFEVHRHADVEHRAALSNLIDKLSPVEQVEALAAAKESAQALWDFLSDVYDRA